MSKAPALLPANVADWDDAIREAQSARKVVEFYNGSGSTISNGRVVILDTSDTDRLGTAIAVSSTTDDAPLAVGIADQDILDGEVGNVVVYGYKANVLTDGSVAAGNLVQVSNTAGAIEAAGAATERGIGVALSTDGGSPTVCDVFVRAQ